MKKIVSLVLIMMLSFSATPSVLFADSDAAGVSGDKVKALEKQLANLQDLITRQSQEIQGIKSNMRPGSDRVTPAPAAEAPKMDKDDFTLLAKEAYPWLHGLKQGGDLRLRYEAFSNSGYEQAKSDGLAYPNRNERNRFRIRLRYGFEKKLAEDWTVGFRLATSGDTGTTVGTPDPTSTNTTMGGYWRDKGFWVDQAFATYTPSYLKELGPIEQVQITGGKFKNPFEKYTGKMIFDRDINPEGLAEIATLGLWKSETNTLKLDVTGGQFILTEGSGAGADAEMFGIQTGLDFATYAFGSSPVESRTGFSFYSYQDYDNTVGAYDLARGNTSVYPWTTTALQNQEPQVFDLYQELKFYPFGKPVTLWGEYAVNGADNHANVMQIDARDANAFGTGITVGGTKKKGEWEAFLNYFYIGANATAGVFADSDFGWYGHTNNKGWNFGMGYALTDFLVLNWNNYVFTPVESYNDPLASSDRAKFTDYRSQLDLVWKF